MRTAQCDFKCPSQIISGTNNDHIRDEGMKKQWQLDDLVKEGRIIESGAIAASEIKKDNAKLDTAINRTTLGSKNNPSPEKKDKNFT